MATIAQLCRGTVSLPLLSQDPDYTEVAGRILTKKESKIVAQTRPKEGELRNLLGQIADYMDVMNLKYGLLTTYEETLFLRQTVVGGQFVLTEGSIKIATSALPTASANTTTSSTKDTSDFASNNRFKKKDEKAQHDKSKDSSNSTSTSKEKRQQKTT
ncbi:hypothetical protein N7516_005524 [Penicillium verrucosum]|uniref:uncharacterized protein n=1 Tax=Penicillium verrucosum TaxID=60171 RepID=UPI0025454FA9|nr:uncharacterized protein N7516_005524 [Penicillium verrucosum]KAJ5945356.1 hypothetical protein N7516_005524 [Penicillium verrucosum]